MVALVMIIFKSGLLGRSCLIKPIRKSILRFRSCASSMIKVSYFFSNGSVCVSASRTPSVMTLILVLLDVLSVKRTLKPTSWPKSTSSSSAILDATERAAILLGWVWPIIFFCPRPKSRQILGSWVVFPEPVSPQKIMTWLLSISLLISSTFWLTGKESGYKILINQHLIF